MFRYLDFLCLASFVSDLEFRASDLKKMDIRQKIQNSIIASLQNLDIDTPEVSLEHPDNIENGDYSTNVALVLAKELKIKPRELADKILAELLKNKPEEISEIGVAGAGFINFYLSPQFFADSVKEILDKKENYGKTENLAGKKIMVDYTDPNPFKEFHIGHLMSNAIGESLCRIFEVNGGGVVRVCYQGDVGLHVAKAIWGILADKNNFPSDQASLSEKIAFLGKAYVWGSQKYEEDEKIVGEIKDLNKKIFEKSDPEINEIYEKGRRWSMDHFDEIYKKLGTQFDHFIPESSVLEDGLQIVKEFLKKGVFEESQGAVVFKGETYGLHTRVFINSQGLPTYETKDLGLAKKKMDLEKGLSLSLVVTANEQNDYFKVVLKALEFIFPEYSKIAGHLGHGMLRFATGKMSSRKGNVITGESLISAVEAMVHKKIADREIMTAEKNKIAECVAIGAIKYSILKQSIGSDIIYDFEKSISFEGDSGPYIQYAYTRARSVLEKAHNSDLIGSVDFGSPQTVGNLEKILYRFPEIAERAGKEYAPHYIATYLIELASVFNNYYANNKIVDKENPEAPYRVALTEAVSIVLKNGLYLLGIIAPQRM